jgi:16S rRNA (uracil1498-N3)-methyltransferase
MVCDEARAGGSSAPPGGLATDDPGEAAREGGRAGPWAILIGPEGGFSEGERARLSAMSQACPVALGPRILRAETAAVAALTLWQSQLGEWAR